MARLNAQVLVRALGGHTPAGRAHHQPGAQQVRLVRVFDGEGSSPQAWASVVSPPAGANCSQSSVRIRRSILSRPSSSTPKSARASRVTVASTRRDPSTEAKSRTRRSSRFAMRGVPRLREAMIAAASSVERDVEQSGRTRRYSRQLLDVVEVELADEAESVAQWRGDEAGPRRRADQREVRKSRRIDRAEGPRPIMTSRRRSSIAGIEHLLDRARESVELVDEEHVTVLQVGEQCREVTRTRQHRTRRDAKTRAHLARDNARERRLAESRRPGEKR